jgi:hypothetical protein
MIPGFSHFFTPTVPFHLSPQGEASGGDSVGELGLDGS